MPSRMMDTAPASNVDVAIPTIMAVGNRTYEILPFLQEGEIVNASEIRDAVVSRVKGMNANLGKDDARFILKHQDKIPAILRGKVVFVFTDWPALNGLYIHCIQYGGGPTWRGTCCDAWLITEKSWGWQSNNIHGVARVLRRK